MAATFVEGFSAVGQACTLPVLLIALVFVMAAGRNAPVAWAGLALAASLIAWARFTRVWTVDVEGSSAAASGLLVALAAVAVARLGSDNPIAAAGGAALAGGVAAALWQPCVGMRLSAAICSASDGDPLALPLTAAYLSGVMAIAGALAVAPVAWPRLDRFAAHRWTAPMGAACGLVVGGLIAAGTWDATVDALLRTGVA